MRHLRMVGLALVAVLATTALAATSASALPEFGECVVQAKHEGKYANSNCTVKAKVVNTKPTGEFEWKKPSEIEGKGIAGEGGPAILKTTFHACGKGENLKECRAGEEEPQLTGEVECSQENNGGEITGSKTVGHVAVRFRHCLLFGSVPCANAGEAGEIETNELKGNLGWINKGTNPRQVGILLEPAVKKGEFVKFGCGGIIIIHVGGATEAQFPAYPPSGGGDGIISPITPVNEMTKAFTQVYAFNAEEENIPNKFEGTAPLKVLEDWLQNSSELTARTKWSKAGEAVTNKEHPCGTTGILENCREGEFDVKAGEIKAN
jgi:hypothetical protein